MWKQEIKACFPCISVSRLKDLIHLRSFSKKHVQNIGRKMKQLCKMKKEKLKKYSFKAGAYVCKKCNRASDKKKALCKPKAQ